MSGKSPVSSSSVTLVRKAIRRLRRRPYTRKIAGALDRVLSFLVIAWSGLLDTEWYRLQLLMRPGGRGARPARRRIPLPRLWLVAHYVLRGRTRGFSPHPLFEPEYFAPKTWRKGFTDPFAKYLRNPEKWRTAPHPWFDGAAYMAANPRARGHRWGPLGHFLQAAGPRTPLPLPGSGLSPAGLTWGAGRELLIRGLERCAAQERLRLTERISDGYDRRLERRFLRRWRDAPLPAPDADPAAPGRGPAAPLVSVVVPVWNRAEQLRAAIASVRAQTLTAWELLVVDDGSTDESAAVVEAIAAADPRVRLLRQPHAGVSRARNLALAHARGRYVAFLDSDNTYVPHFLRTAVAAMHGRSWRLAHAILEVHAGPDVRYRALGGGRAFLELRNHIDLNVVVAERTLLAAAGPFDEHLKRTVDYDLILRMDAIAPVRFMPFTGVRYDDTDDPSRITNNELFSWFQVVQNNNLIDWKSAGSGRVAGRVSVIVPTCQDWQLTRRCVASLLAAQDDTEHDGIEDDLEIVVLDNASRRPVGAILAAGCAADPRVRYLREPVNRGLALGRNLAFAHSTGETIVFIDHAVEVRPGWLEPLRRALGDPAVRAAQPLVLHPDGSVRCAGMVFPSRGVFPVPFLAGHPVEDAARLGESFGVSAVTGAALAIRAGDFAALTGFDPIYEKDNGTADADLCLRLRQLRPGAPAVVTGSVVVDHHGSGQAADRAYGAPAASLEVFRRRWAGRVPSGDERLWESAGFTVAHYRTYRMYRAPTGGQGAARPEHAEPVLTRRRGRVPDGPARGLPAFRWALKIAAPPGTAGLAWGDLHFARALGAALARLGQEVVIDSRDAHDRASAYLDDVVLALRGLTPVAPRPGGVNLLWVISHPDLVGVDEIGRYDGVFAAGPGWAARMSERLGRPVETLLQCTDPERFHPGVARPDTGDPVLFVGNSRNIFRPIVRDACELGFEVAVYGGRWETFIDRRFIRGQYIPNERVAAAYRSAGVVLNDHWEDMRREGFISNRVFDAAAAGARVVSDDVAGIEEHFSGLVHVYRTKDELAELLARPRDAFPDEARRLRLADMVRREHSFDARARELLAAAVRLWS